MSKRKFSEENNNSNLKINKYIHIITTKDKGFSDKNTPKEKHQPVGVEETKMGTFRRTDHQQLFSVDELVGWLAPIILLDETNIGEKLMSA